MKWNLVVAIICISSLKVTSQFDFGISAGLSTMDVEAKHLSFIFNDREQFNVKTQEARYGIQFGAFAIAQFSSFYLMPEIILHSQKFNHYLSEINSTGEVINVVRDERLTTADLSLMMGWKWYFIRLGAGPVATMHVDNVSQLWTENGYDQSIDPVKWGAQAGFGLDILMVHLDLRYQFDFSQFGDHIEFFGSRADLNDHSGLWTFRVGWSF